MTEKQHDDALAQMRKEMAEIAPGKLLMTFDVSDIQEWMNGEQVKEIERTIGYEMKRRGIPTPFSGPRSFVLPDKPDPSAKKSLDDLSMGCTIRNEVCVICGGKPCEHQVP